jgi:hypothetical protein
MDWYPSRGYVDPVAVFASIVVAPAKNNAVAVNGA